MIAKALLLDCLLREDIAGAEEDLHIVSEKEKASGMNNVPP